MGILGLSSAINEYIGQSVNSEKLGEQTPSRLIFDGHAFVEQIITSEQPFAGTDYPALKWINRGDKRQLAIYIYKYIKAFIDNKIHVTIVSSGPHGEDEEKFSNAYFRGMFKALKYSKQFYREGVALEPSKFKVKVLPKFNNLITSEILNILAQEYPQYLTIVKCPSESTPYILEIARRESSIIVSNNADLLLTGQAENVNLTRFYDITLQQREKAEKDTFDIFAKIAKSDDAVQHLLSKWKLESKQEFNLTLSLMKSDYTEESDVRKFIGDDLYNLEKAAAFVREQVDLLKEDESITQDKIVSAVIEKAYKDNASAIENSSKAYAALSEPVATKPAIDLSDDSAYAKALLPEYIQKTNEKDIVQKFKACVFPGQLIGLTHTLHSYESVDLLSCSTDTFSPSELWYALRCKINEVLLLSNASPLRIDPEYESKQFDSEYYGKLERDSIEIKTNYQEKGIYLVNGSEKVHTFARDYAKYETSDLRKSFIQLWIPENSQKTVEDYETALKNVPAIYQPFVLVLTQLYHLLAIKDPKPKVDFLFLNEVIFASLFLDEPLNNAKDLANLGKTEQIYTEEMASQNEFVNSNFYRYFSYFEEGLSQFFVSNSTLGWFSDIFHNFATSLLVNGTYGAYLRTIYNSNATEEALINLMPEATRTAYTATKDAIRSLCTKEVSQHFWVEDSADLLNTKTIFASNIPFNMKAADFYKLFEGITLKKVYLKSAESGAGHIGRGTLEFEDEENMKKALLFNRHRFDDRYIHLTPSIAGVKHEPAQKPVQATTTNNALSETQWTKQGAATRGGKPRGRGRGRGAASGGSERGGRGRGGGATRGGRPPVHKENIAELVVDNKWGALMEDADE